MKMTWQVKAFAAKHGDLSWELFILVKASIVVKRHYGHGNS